MLQIVLDHILFVASYLIHQKKKKEREKENQLKTIWTLISDNKSI